MTIATRLITTKDPLNKFIKPKDDYDNSWSILTSLMFCIWATNNGLSDIFYEKRKLGLVDAIVSFDSKEQEVENLVHKDLSYANYDLSYALTDIN